MNHIDLLMNESERVEEMSMADNFDLSNKAEELRKAEFRTYEKGATIEERVGALKNVLQCYYIKVKCQMSLFGASCLPLKAFIRNWLQKSEGEYDAEVVEGLYAESL